MRGQLPRYMGGDWPHNQGGYNRGVGLDVETRVLSPRALMLRRGWPSLVLRLEPETLACLLMIFRQPTEPPPRFSIFRG